MKKPNWKTIKLVALNWVIFVLIVSAYALYTLNERNQELRQEVKICQHNLIEIEKQIDQGSIILRLEKK